MHGKISLKQRSLREVSVLSFLTYQPDLSETHFAAQSQYFQDIRIFLVTEIRTVAPGWLDDPKGILGELWNKDELDATCHLIWIANILLGIGQKIDQASLVRLRKKFQALLSAKEPKYSEYRAELEVGSYLAEHMDSLVIEPLASGDGNTDLSQPTRSPDFAFELEGTMYLEVTVFNVGILDTWQRAVDYIASSLQRKLLKEGRHLKLHLQLPLQAFEAKQPQKFDANQVIQHIWRHMHSPSGELTITHQGKISWEPYPITAVQEGLPLSPEALDKGTNIISQFGNWHADINIKSVQDGQPLSIQITPFGIFHSPNVVIDQASFVKEPSTSALPEKDVGIANELMLKSLKHKLKVKKREQFPLRHQKPYLLAMKPGHYRLQGNQLFKVIDKHIWSHDDFDWISGIILFTSRQGFKTTDPINDYYFFFNPKAACPVNELVTEKFQLRVKRQQTT